MKISSVYVNGLLGNGGREVIWPGANCGGDHVLPATLNVKTEPDVTGRRDEGGEATIAASQRGGGCIGIGARVVCMPARERMGRAGKSEGAGPAMQCVRAVLSV